MMLDIIVPHYNEPWKEVRKLFDMLSLQRAVDFKDFRVILVNDGEQCPLMPDVVKQKYPFSTVGITIPHAGVSEARNRGLMYSNAHWVMFCDCDDTFASVYALRSIFDVLETEDFDLLWMPFYVEIKVDRSRQVRKDYNALFIHSKVFRRKFLIDHGLSFNPDLAYSEDTAFLAVVGMEIDKNRIGEIKAEAPMYIWTWRKGSATTDPDRSYLNAVNLFRRQRYVADEYTKRGMLQDAAQYNFRALCDAFVTLKRTDFSFDRSDFKQEVKELYRNERGVTVDADTLGRAMRGAINESGVNPEYAPDTSKFLSWLNELETEVKNNGGD